MASPAPGPESGEGEKEQIIDGGDGGSNQLGAWLHETPPEEDGLEIVEQEAPPEFVEVFVGGLPSDVTEDDVRPVFEKVGEVLNVRLNRRKKTGECKGFGFVRYRDQLTAEVACRDINEVNGKEVGVHISRPREIESDANILLAGLDSEGGINKLLKLIHQHPDRKAAVAAAIKAVVAQAPRRTAHRALNGEPLRPGEDLGLDDPSLPDPSTFLQDFTKCKQLVERFRENPNTSNKTPLAILHEYATRLNLELKYEQNAESNLGPFTTGAKLMSPGGGVTYAEGEGRGRSKKEAKQVTAAAVLEDLLDKVPIDNFLQTAKKTIVRGPAMAGGRTAVALRGRGRGRASIGQFGRASLDFLPGTFNNFSGGPNGTFDLSLTTPSNSLPQPQALLQHHPAESLRNIEGVQNTQTLRAFLANSTIDPEMLARMRGQSLDSLTSNIRRQYTQNAPSADMSVYGNSRSFDNSGFSSGVPIPDPQQDALFQRQRAQFQQQFASIPDATFNNLAQGNNLFNAQNFQNSGPASHLPFQQY